MRREPVSGEARRGRETRPLFSARRQARTGDATSVQRQTHSFDPVVVVEGQEDPGLIKLVERGELKGHSAAHVRLARLCAQGICIELRPVNECQWSVDVMKSK